MDINQKMNLLMEKNPHFAIQEVDDEEERT